MSSKARGLADLGNAFDDGALSNRNLIINGAMQVAQRGNRSPSGFTGSFYAGPDRWLVNRTGTGDTGFSQISSTDYGGTKAAQATFLAAAGEAFVVTQRIEAANIAHLAGQTVTLSFWASGSSDAGSATLNAILSYASAVDNFTTETTVSSNSVSYSGTAAYYTFTFTLPAGAANGVGVKFEGAKTDATGTFTLTFGGVQLEVGDTATPFEHPRSFGDELARCQRYFEKNFNQADAPSAGRSIPDRTTGVVFNSLNYGFEVNFSVTKRTAPTMVYYRGNNAGSASSGTVNRYNGSAWLEETLSGGGRQTETFAGQDANSSGLSVGDAYILQFGFTADAEL